MKKNKMFLSFINGLLYLSGCFPILSIYDDNEYPCVQISEEASGERKWYEWRISLFNFMAGAWSVRIGSIKIKPHLDIKLIIIHSMNNVQRYELSDVHANDLKYQYENHLKKINENEQNIEKESLVRHLSDENDRIEKSFSKVNVLSTFLLMILPIALTFVGYYKNHFVGIIQIILLVALLYAFFNMFCLVLQTFKVHGYSKSTFSDLKSSDNKTIEFISQIYYDWQQIKIKADSFVSYVELLHKWIMYSAVIASLLFITLGYDKVNKNVIPVMTSEVYTLNTKKIQETYSDDAVKWSEIQLKLQKNTTQDVVILFGNESDIIDLRDVLDIFDKQDIRYIVDDNLDKNAIKIILEN